MGTESILIVGNGFDLNCGLKTRYTDVYAEYVLTKSDSKTICSFKEDISDNFANWSDFELGMVEYAKRLNSCEELMECVNDFNHFMHQYLLELQENFHSYVHQLSSVSRSVTEMKRSIGSLGIGITHNTDSIINNRQANTINNLSIISFNYTDTFEYLYSQLLPGRYHPIPLHIHGVLSDDPILGVDNDEQLSVPYSINNKTRRCFIKPYFNLIFDEKRVQKAREMIAGAKTIFTFGASLGDSDLTWRNEIINRLNSDNNVHLFIYKYEYSSRSYKTVSERINVEEDAKMSLLKSWGVEDSEKILEQVHIPCGINLFDFETALRSDEKDSRKK